MIIVMIRWTGLKDGDRVFLHLDQRPLLPYRGTSLIRNSAPLGPYSRTMPRALWWSYGGGRFLMSEVPLYRASAQI